MILNHTPLNFFEKEFSAGCQPRYPVKIPKTTWKSLSPPRGLHLYPSCQARCPVKTSNEMENYPAPSAAQLLTMLLHREHFCSYFYYNHFSEKINPYRDFLIIYKFKKIYGENRAIFSCLQDWIFHLVEKNQMSCGGIVTLPNTLSIDREPDNFNKYQIIIGNDVWIGCDVTILGGVRIGKGAVIGAGIMVTKDIPPYAVVMGNPGRPIICNTYLTN